MRAHLVDLYKVTFAANFLGTLISARQVGERVVNGQNATQGQFPHQVSWLDANNKHQCGGSIFSETTSITAAHCCEKLAKWPYLLSTKIVAGELDLSVTSGLEQVRRVISSIIHPDYNSATLPRFQHDICLLKLESPLELNENVRRIYLDEEDPTVGTQCHVSGWGTLVVSIRSACSTHTFFFHTIARPFKKYIS